MTTISAPTSHSPEEALRLALEWFVGKHHLALIETSKHLHGQTGAVEISVTGDRIVGKEKFEAMTVLNQLASWAEDRFGLTPIYALLHIHASPEDTSDLMVQITYGDRTAVKVETRKFVPLAKEFMSSLPPVGA